jgi:glucosyl-dolichyl phosphate glucuronosyltransferase
MTRLVVPPDISWEILVVNNRCTDATDAVIGSFGDRLPIRREFEERPGLANARNRAVKEASGDYIIWTDDDILVDEEWLSSYVKAFRQWPEASLFGGPIEPEFEGSPPDWILAAMDRIGPVYGRQNLGDLPVQITPDVLPFGPYGGNMAARRDALLRFPYDPELGVRHGEYMTGEETRVHEQMLAAGLTGWWSPEPRVRHCIPRDNQSTRYIRRWFMGRGKTAVRMNDTGIIKLARRPSRLIWRALRAELRYRLRRFTAEPDTWIYDLMVAAKLQGAILALVQLRIQGRKL